MMWKLSISFDSQYIKKNGECAIYVVARSGQLKTKFNTQVSVKPSEFNKQKKIVKNFREDHEDLNLMIQTTRSRLNEIIVRYRLQYEELTPDLLKKEFKNSSTRLDVHTFLSEAIHERRGEISFSSMKQHYSMANKLKRFSPTLKFSQLDSDFMSRFNRWLIRSEENGQNTRYNNFKSLKAYLNIAIRKRVVAHHPLADWMPVKKSNTSREFLTEDEIWDLVGLYDREYLPDNLQKVLRHFLFMCFTGLRISDLKSVTMEQIINGTLIYNAIKTKNSKREIIKVPLTPTPLRLIQDEAPHRLYGNIFNTYSEQQMRTKIKDIVKVVNINKDISLHTARHTFATMFLRNSKNLAVLQRLLGHSNIAQTMIYAHVLTEDIEREVQIAFSRFS